jgi:hypothetical protein
MALSFSTTLRNNRLDQITSAVGGSGSLRIYSGTAPANVGAALSGNTLLAELALNSTFAPAASSGTLSLNQITQDTSANATGEASFFRLLTSGGTAIVQGTVGTSGADLNLNSVSISSGAAVSVTAFSITEANS